MRAGTADELRPPRAAPAGALPWIVCGLGALYFFYAYFQRVAPSVMVGELMRDLAADGVVLGNFTAFYFYAYGLLQIPAGLMHDAWGPRRVLTGAALVAGAGSLIFALADGVSQAYAGRFLLGAGSAFAWVGLLKFVSVWFPPHRFALVSGLGTLIGTVGGVSGQAPLATAVAAVGWRATVVTAAAFALVLAAAIWLIARDAPAGGTPARVRGATGSFVGLRRALANRRVWFVAAAGSMLSPAAGSFAGLWGVPYMMTAHGLDRPAAAAAMSLVLIGFGAGAPVLGWLSDRIRRRKAPMIGGAVLALAAMLALVYGPRAPLPVAYGLCLLYGLGTSAFLLCYAIGRELSPGEASAAVMGLINMTVVVGSAAIAPLIGFVLDRTWDGRLADGARIYAAEAFETGFLILVATGVLAVLAALAVPETRCQPLATPVGGDGPAVR